MSGEADSNDEIHMKELRRAFDKAASQDVRTMQEMDEKICEVSQYIEQMQIFLSKKSSEMEDLRKTISDPTTRRAISSYSMATDIIQKLENKVADNAEDIMRLKEVIADKDLQLSMVKRSAEENSVRIKELSVDIVEKQRLIDEMNKQIVHLTEAPRKEYGATETHMLPINEQETKNSTDDRNELILQKDATIKRLKGIISQLQQNLLEKETQQCISRKLSITMKIRQLEPLAKQSPEIEELLNKLRQETAITVERQVNADSCHATDSNGPASGSPDKPLRG
jgi:hypothetical protein